MAEIEITGGPKTPMTDQQVMDKVFGVEEPAEDTFARMFPDAKEKAVAAEPGDSGDEAAASGEPDTKVESGDTAFDEAWAALERDGFKKSVLKRLSREEILSAGTHRAKVQADVDQAYADLKALKGKSPSPEGDETKTPEATADSAGSDDLLAGLSVLEQLEDPKMAELLKGVVGPLAKELVALRELANGYIGQASEREAQRVRGELVKAGYDGLSDDIAWDAAKAAARELLDANGGDGEKAVKAAVVRIYGDRAGKRPGPIKNVATIPSRRDGPVAKTREQREFLALKAITDGLGREEARKFME